MATLYTARCAAHALHQAAGWGATAEHIELDLAVSTLVFGGFDHKISLPGQQDIR